MNSYIKQLKESKKLIISIDKKEKFFEIKKPYIIAGPCSIESEKMILNFSKKLKKLGVSAIRAGAYKPATFPVRKKINGWQEGLKKEGLKHLLIVKKITKLPIVSEIMDQYQYDNLAEEAIDIIQVGTRNFQNYTLLDFLGGLKKPILLKRGTWATVDEILGAAERILSKGNKNVAICLRGVVGMPS